jgi:hypothetical protein
MVAAAELHHRLKIGIQAIAAGVRILVRAASFPLILRKVSPFRCNFGASSSIHLNHVFRLESQR